MGERSFRYDIKNKHRLVHAFRYWFDQSIAYGFAYQRFVALYDTRIFDSPVVITKVTTGLPFIFGLFAHPRHSFDMDTLSGFNVWKEATEINDVRHCNVYFVAKDGKSFIPKKDVLLGVSHQWLNDVIASDPVLSAYSESSRLSFSIYPNFNATPNDIVTNWLPNILGKLPDNKLNRLDTLLASPRTAIMSLNYDWHEYHGAAHPNIGNVYDTFLGRPHDIVVNILPDIHGDRINDDILEYYVSSFQGAPANKTLHGNEQITASIRRLYLQDNQWPSGAAITSPVVDYLCDHAHASRADRYSYVNHDYSASRAIGNAIAFDVQAARRQSLYGRYDAHVVHGYITHKEGYYGRRTFFGAPIVKYAGGNQAMSAYLHSRIGVKQPEVVAANILADNTALLCQQDMFAVDTAIPVHNLASALFITRTKVSAYTSNSVFLNNQNRVGRTVQESVSVFRRSVEGSLRENIFVANYARDAIVHQQACTLYRIRYNATEGKNGTVFIDKVQSSMRIMDAGKISVYKNDKDMTKQIPLVCVDKTQHSLSLHRQLQAHKTLHGMSLVQSKVSAHQTARSFVIDESTVFASKVKNGIFSSQVVSLYLKKKDIQIYADTLSLLKCALSVQNTGALDSAIKSVWHVRLHNFDNGYNGLIIPVTKSHMDVSAFNNEIGEMACKSSKDILVTEGAMASVLKKPSFLSGLDYLGPDKLYHNVMMDVYNYFAKKAAIRVMVQDNLHLYRMPYDVFLTSSIPQIWKAIYTDEPEDPPGDEPDPKPVQNFGIFFSQAVWAAKVEHDTVVYSQGIDAQKMQQNAHAYLAEFAGKNKYGLYYFYDVFTGKTKDSIAMLSSLQATPKSDGVALYTALPASAANRQGTLYEPIVYGMGSPVDAEIVQQLKAFERSRKEVEEFLSDFGNWAWVYETPSPFDSKTYGIDELLLPEEDPRYEYFEDIIFDKESMTPRDPVKILGPTSFLARYPIEMPIEEFADIGNIYEDSAEKWEQYFGIETDVMRDIYLKYYQIWQAKIFEFSTMTMVQSTKKMLEYLYTWIDMYYPVEKMQQALRVFRQIRWFSESAIIKNSQYIISYEYDTLKSNLHTGTCHVPNDLDTVTNPTMYVDKPNAVIRNDKAFLGSDAHVTFEIDNPKNTYIKFDLFTEYGKGSALVYLNDVLVRVCTSVSLGVIIQIPYTGAINRVTIMKTASSNIGEFYIGNISVPNASFKNLTIEFDPVLRAGNKPLEEVAKKMIACANLYANKNEMYAVIKRSNLGFTETYRQMNDYWKLHHQDQTKGKRLTIKQV